MPVTGESLPEKESTSNTLKLVLHETMKQMRCKTAPCEVTSKYSETGTQQIWNSWNGGMNWCLHLAGERSFWPRPPAAVLHRAPCRPPPPLQSRASVVCKNKRVILVEALLENYFRRRLLTPLLLLWSGLVNSASSNAEIRRPSCYLPLPPLNLNSARY